MWTEFIWVMIGTNGRQALCEDGNELLTAVKGMGFLD
jgi:hypothetical protein